MKSNKKVQQIVFLLSVAFVLNSCNVSKIALKEVDKEIAGSFGDGYTNDTMNSASINWRSYFDDPYLISLIDTALENNQELNIVLQEIEIDRNEVMERKGEYLPTVNIGTGMGTDKVGRFTRNGAVENALDIAPDTEFPEPLGDFVISASASWEIDIWKKLRNAKDAAELRLIAQMEGKNFLVTELISEIAKSYYELMALDNQLEIINNNVIIQTDALDKVRLQKENARSTQLAVNRFEAQLLKTTNLQFNIRQRITTTENRIHLLVGKYSPKIDRKAEVFLALPIDSVRAGIPSQLLLNRPDVRQAEHQLEAANLEVKVARADFYPNLGISAGLGFQAFNPSFLFNPESLLFNLAGDLVAPLVNKKGIQARYNRANAIQIQAVYNYEQILLFAYTDVLNELNKLENFSLSVEMKSKEVDILNNSIQIANSLYQSARADYVEVLLTQEEALYAKIELVEIKLDQLVAKIDIYRALGGGWQY